MVEAVPAPVFVLPDRAAKEAYLSSAVRLARTYLISDFISTVGFLPAMAWLSLSFELDLQSGPGPLYVMALSLLASLVLRYAISKRAENRLSPWLRSTGTDGFLDAGRAEKKPWARRWLGRGWALQRCRPAWMAVSESAAMSAFALSVALSSALENRRECRQALGAWWRAQAPLPTDCFGWDGGFMAFLAAALLACAAWMFWDWWRWNERHP